jgi:hypothetical protein
MQSTKFFARQLPRIPRAGRNVYRTKSTISTSPTRRTFWTTSRVLLLTTFTGSLTYLYGINDGRFSPGSKRIITPVPSYGTKGDMEKVYAPTLHPLYSSLNISKGNPRAEIILGRGLSFYR